ncbi:Crp/Fnr family transcriptional regulator [Streptomyces sp. NPDC018955]|uniref:Crp/Fnr family transcriptional regulator n=1 Tax=Streptomyces sp. NPDC018955 TaxID=3365055 RepID=UPI0037B97074
MALRRESPRSLLRSIPLFNQLDAESLTHLAAFTRTFPAAKGQVVVEAGTRPGAFYCLITGQVRLVVSAAFGEEKVISIVSPGQTFGEALLFTGAPYPVSAVTLCDCLLLSVPFAPVLELAHSRTGFAFQMAAGLAVRLQHFVMDIEQYALRSGTERVLDLLRRLAEESCPAPHPAPAVVTLPASKNVVASRLSLKPETFSRILRRLTDMGAIRMNGRTIVLVDLDAAGTPDLI